MNYLEKYKPETYKNIIGNKTTYDKLLKDLKKSKYRGKYLLSGKSGTGRTTFVKILSKEKKFKIQEIKINDISTRGESTNNSLRIIFKKSIIPKIILIDDIDLATNLTSIRNSVESKLKKLKELINKDKTNLIFIISTENKKSIFKEYNKLKTFVFKKNREDTIIKYILNIIKQEGLKISEKTGETLIEKIVKNADCNIRKILTDLNMLTLKTSKISFTEKTKETLQNNKKDKSFKDMYDFLGASLKPYTNKNDNTYEEKSKMYYTDSFLLSAATYEYYLKGENVKNTTNIDLIYESIDSIVDGDVLENSRRDADFSLMPYIGHLSFIKPNQLTGKPKTQLFFPANVSQTNKVLNNRKKIIKLGKEFEEKLDVRDYNFEDYITLYTIQNKKKLKKKEQYVNQTTIKNIFSLVNF